MILGTLIPSLIWGQRTDTFGFLPLTEPGSVSYWPFPVSVVISGFVVGLCQWRMLKPLLASSRPAMAWLWVFGVWAGIGVGFWAPGYVASFAFGPGWQSDLIRLLCGALWGAFAGLISLGTLWILRR